MAGFLDDNLDAIDERIRKAMSATRTWGFVQSVDATNFLAQVVMAGTTVAVPAKLFQHTWCEPDDLVGLDLYGSDWFVTGVAQVTPYERAWRESGLQQNGVVGSTSSGSYADMPGNPSWTVNKQFDATKLRHDFACSMYPDVLGRVAQLGVQLDGGSTLDVVKGHWADTLGSGGGYRMFIVGWVYQTGIAKGTHTAEARWKTGGAGTITTDTDDRWSFSTRELVG